MMAILIASGLDPARSVIFHQDEVWYVYSLQKQASTRNRIAITLSWHGS
jgi:tryptophanyl-tRNA synthetase